MILFFCSFRLFCNEKHDHRNERGKRENQRRDHAGILSRKSGGREVVGEYVGICPDEHQQIRDIAKPQRGRNPDCRADEKNDDRPDRLAQPQPAKAVADSATAPAMVAIVTQPK